MTKIVTAFNLDGTTTKLVCRVDEVGNLQIINCLENRKAMGKVDNHPAFGCFVPKDGNVRYAKENSIVYHTGEGKNFIVGENPNGELSARLHKLAEDILVDNELAARINQMGL